MQTLILIYATLILYYFTFLSNRFNTNLSERLEFNLCYCLSDQREEYLVLNISVFKNGNFYSVFI